MRPPDVPAVAVSRVLAECERRAERSSPDGIRLARRTFGRLAPADWTLEWRLPVWLGDAFGLDRALSEELVVSNLLGLASIRLQDDVIDGDVDDDEVEQAATVATVLLDEALGIYLRRFDAGSPFWRAFDRWMSEWRSASANVLLTADRLSQRGAPLKVSAYAVCLLADRADAWPGVEGCLDHALAALVLYDQFVDWEEDLSAGRWNAFIASVTDRPQSLETREQNRTTVQAALMSRGVAAAHFGLVRREALAAAAGAAAVGCEPLARFLERYAARTEAQGREIEAHYRGVAERAVTIMFGSATAPMP